MVVRSPGSLPPLGAGQREPWGGFSISKPKKGKDSSKPTDKSKSNPFPVRKEANPQYEPGEIPKGSKALPEDKVGIPNDERPTEGFSGKGRNFRGKLTRQYPTESRKGRKLQSTFAGGGMVTFTFNNKDYYTNEQNALKLLKFYRRHIVTWQVVKAWYAKGAIKRTPKERYRLAGKNKVVGYSKGFGPQRINAAQINYAVRQTQASVKSALSGQVGQYKSNLAVIYKPAGFTSKDSKVGFKINLFFTQAGLNAWKKQSKL